MINTLTERAISSFGVSIGTGLMLESLFKPTTKRYDDTRAIPDNKATVNDFKYHYINVFTLVRNILSAASIKNKDLNVNKKTIESIAKVLTYEIDLLFGLYDGSNCHLVLYMLNYDKTLNAMNSGIKIASGGMINKVEKNVLEEVLDIYDIYKRVCELSLSDILIDVETQPNIRLNKHKEIDTKILITTSYPLDLLNHHSSHFNIRLLESHTGVIKSKMSWYTKYNNIKDIMLPFSKYLLYVFGDTSGDIKPLGIKERRDILEIAKLKNWSPITTDEKVKFDINNSTIDSVIKKQILEIPSKI